MPSGIASAAATPRPSAQPSSVLPTASQKLDWVSWSPSVPRVFEIGGKWRLGRTPMRGSTSKRTSTPSTLSHGRSQSGSRRRAPSGRLRVGLASVATVRPALGLPDQVVQVRLLLEEAVLLGERGLLLDGGPAQVGRPQRQSHGL